MAPNRTWNPRRRFLQGGLALTGLGLLAGCGTPPLPWQQPVKPPLIGFLATGAREGRAPLIEAFLQGLQEVGYAEGQGFTIEYRFAARSNDLVGLAAELVGLKTDVILASGTPARLAAKEATTTVPIVMGGQRGPGRDGARREPRAAGRKDQAMSLLSPQVMGKRLELLKEFLPGLTRVAVLSNETNPLHVPQDKEIEAAGRALGIDIHILPVRSSDDFEAASRMSP